VLGYLIDQDQGDEKARDHEEDIDSPGHLADKDMEDDDEECCNRP
jgi:hypothetical protein